MSETNKNNQPTPNEENSLLVAAWQHQEVAKICPVQLRPCNPLLIHIDRMLEQTRDCDRRMSVKFVVVIVLRNFVGELMKNQLFLKGRAGLNGNKGGSSGRGSIGGSSAESSDDTAVVVE